MVFDLLYRSARDASISTQTARLAVVEPTLTEPRFENMEVRLLLDVSPTEFNQIRTMYPDLGLSATMGDYNIIEITAGNLTEGNLRDAIAEAGGTAKSDLIVIRTTASQHTIYLTSELVIDFAEYNRGSVTIVSLGDAPLTLDAQQNSRVLNIDHSSAVVSLAGLTITNGFATDEGGGIYNKGTLTVAHSTIAGNTAFADTEYSDVFGGGIYNDDGTLTVTHSTIADNTAYADASYSSYAAGGGIYSYDGTVTVTHSTITGNTASADSLTSSEYGSSATAEGGGLYNNYGTMTVTDSTITGNTASADSPVASEYGSYAYAEGGGIKNRFGTMTVVDSTITGNETTAFSATSVASADGSGIYNGDGELTVTHSTIAGNTASADGRYASASAGGIGIYGGTVTVTYSSIADNAASSTSAELLATTAGGGICNNGGTVTLAYSTVTGNESSASSLAWGGGIYNIWGELTMTNVAVTGNTAFDGYTSEGGGIYNETTLTMTNVLLAGNEASVGGGLFNVGYGEDMVTVTNSTITGNTALMGAGIFYSTNGNDDVMLTLANTIVAGNVTTFPLFEIYCPAGVIYGYNNLTTYTNWSGGSRDNLVYDPAKPLFVDAANGNYKLAADSQAIDAGDDDLAYAAGLDVHSRDLAGKPRFSGGTIDIGAYEYDFGFDFIASQSSVYRGNVTLEWSLRENVDGVRLTWVSGTTSVVLGTFFGDGSYAWNTTVHADAPGILRVESLDGRGRAIAKTEWSATIINDSDIAVHRGEVDADETWAADKVHLVIGRLDVQDGVSLTVATGAVVKFWKNSYLYINAGASLDILSDAVLTRSEDDFVSGDTNKDGNLSTPKSGNSYLRGPGTMHVHSSVVQKYMIQSYSGTLAADDTWLGDGQVYRITGTITIPAGVTLTILPGAILKFDANCSLIVQTGGTLIAEGSAAQPIVFTSIKDDTYGGDTNEDGDATRPLAGDWNQIRANGGTITLNHTRVSYCSNASDQGGIYVNGGSVTFDNSIIEYTKYDSLHCSSGTLTARNSVIRETSVAVGYYSGSGTTLINCVIDRATVAVRGGGKTFINTVFSNITSTFSESSGGTFQNCAFWNPRGSGPQSFSAAGSNGNFWADPMFRDAANGDYRLRAGSPLIDAADGTRATVTDILGSPRVSDSHMVDKRGVPDTSGNYVDIGAYEFTDYATSTIDLEPVNLQAPSSVSAGEKITVQWTVRNNGSSPAAGTWTDRIVMISAAGQVVVVGDVAHAGNIGGGDLQTFYAELTVPAVAEGAWRFAVLVNVNRNMFEGTNTENNEFRAAGTVTVSVAPLAGATLDLSVVRGSPKLYKIELPAGEALYLSATSTGAISMLLADGRAPTATSWDYAAASDGNGTYAAYIPPSETTRTMYLSIATDTATANVSLAVSDATLAVASVRQSTVSNAGVSTIGFLGAGFDSSMSVSLKLGGTTIPGTLVSISSGSLASAQFDLTGKPAGAYDLVITKGENTVTLAGAVTVAASSVGARLAASFDVPDAVRTGRVYLGYIVYTNTGDCDVLVPVFTLSSRTGTPIGLTPDSLVTGEEISILGLGSADSAGVLRPGETARVAFYFRATDNTNVHFGTWWQDETADPMLDNDHWDTWSEYHRDISEAATRLGLRGYFTSDFNEVRSFTVARKLGQDTTGLSGQLRNAQTGEAVANASIVAEWIVDGETRFDLATTDANGHYVFNYLPADATVTLSLSNTAYDLSVTTVHISDGQDVNGFNLTARPYGSISGFVRAADGRGIEGAFVRATNSAGDVVVAETDSHGVFLLDSLIWDTWTVEIRSSGLSLLSQTVTVNSSQVSNVPFTLATTGTISGRVLDSSSRPQANTVVNVLNERGEWVAVGETDASGNYLIENVPAGTYRIVAVNSALSWAPREITVTGGETVTMNLTASSVALSGKVFVSAGIPATGGTVVIYTAGDTDEFVLLFTDIGGDGSYRFDSLVPGDYRIEVYTESGTAFVPITIGGSSGSLDITLAAQTEFSGQVNFGSPIPPGAAIYVVIVSSDETVKILAQLDAAGNFTVGKIPQGNYTVKVVSGEDVLAEQDVTLNTAVQSVQIESAHVFPVQSAAAEAKEMPGATMTRGTGSYSVNQLYNYYHSFEAHGGFARFISSLIEIPDNCPNCSCTDGNDAIYGDSLNQAERAIDAYNELVRYVVRGLEAVICIQEALAWLQPNIEAQLGIERLFTPPVPVPQWLAALDCAADVVNLALARNWKDETEAMASVMADEFNFAWTQFTILQMQGGYTFAGIRENLRNAMNNFRNLARALENGNYAIDRIESCIAHIEENNAKYQRCNCERCREKPKDWPEDDDNPDNPQSEDPNEIHGPVGYDFETVNTGTADEPLLVITTPNWITGNRGQTITVYFENKSSATAAAQEITISMQMPGGWDWSTFTLGSVCIGGQIFTQMAGDADGTWYLRQDSTGDQIQLTVTYDADTGSALWYMRSYVEGAPYGFPVSAYDGFLPPNDDAGAGEGYITFDIRVRDGLATGTVMESHAVIVFDDNAEIVTNTWKNTVDSNVPTSRVTAFNSSHVGAQFTVRWSGSDSAGGVAGSGVAGYDVYVSVDGGEFVKWMDRTTATSATYNGQVGSTYAFYSVAYDNVGHAESAAKTAEATVTATDTSDRALDKTVMTATKSTVPKTTVGAQSVTLQWAAPKPPKTGSPAAATEIDGYWIEWYAGKSKTPADCLWISADDAAVAGNKFEIAITGLQPGGSCSFRIYTTTAATISTKYAKASAKTKAIPAPTSVKANAKLATIRTATLTWKVSKPATVPADMQLVRYDIYANNTNGEPIGFVPAGGPLTFTAENLSPKTGYTFYVVAVYAPVDEVPSPSNEIRSAKPVKVKAKTAKFVAPKLTRFAAGAIDATRVTLGWNPIVGADNFIVTYAAKGETTTTLTFGPGENTNYTTDDAGNITGVTIDGLSPGTKYTITIQGMNTALNAKSAITKKAVTTLKTPVARAAVSIALSSALPNWEPLTLPNDVAAFHLGTR